MSLLLEDIESAALKLPLSERSHLAERLTASVEAEADETPQAIASAWDVEITRRLEDLKAGRSETVPYEQVRAELRAMIDAHGAKQCPNRPSIGKQKFEIALGVIADPKS